jgi:type IV pilus assembly protein PilE
MMIKQKGITLVELMIVVVVVAILASIAVPSYQGYVQRSKRVTAEGDLYAFRNAMQRFFAENNTHSGATTAADGTAGAPIAALFPSQSPVDGGTAAYNLTVNVAVGGASYTLQATPTGGQAGDVCGNLTLNSINVRGVSASTVANCWK